jgi:hypothetical protein
MIRIFIFVLGFATGVIAYAQTDRSTPFVECSELKLGQSVQHKTKISSSESVRTRVYATVRISRSRNDTKGDACPVQYHLLVAKNNGAFVVVKTFATTTDSTIGAEIVGFSKDQSKLAADFWWAAGDYTGHRPVVYDIKTRRVQLAELGEQITSRLPSCDYSQAFEGVSDSGEAIIHVPKSTYVEEGCPDQGDWLFNLAKRTARRATQ